VCVASHIHHIPNDKKKTIVLGFLHANLSGCGAGQKEIPLQKQNIAAATAISLFVFF
jgi:hypothetical protein